MIAIYIGMDVHKRTVYITEMEEDGIVCQQYEIENNKDAWDAFISQYLEKRPEIALEMSTSGKYVARVLSNSGL